MSLAVVGQPEQHGGGIDRRERGALGIPVDVVRSVAERPPDRIRRAPDQPDPGCGVLRQREKRRPSADDLPVGAFQPQPDRPRDPVAEAQGREVFARQCRLHLPIALPVEGHGEVERPRGQIARASSGAMPVSDAAARNAASDQPSKVTCGRIAARSRPAAVPIPFSMARKPPSRRWTSCRRPAIGAPPATECNSNLGRW